MKATEQYFLVKLFIMLYKVVLTFETVDKILKCNRSNESYWSFLGAVYYAVQGRATLCVCEFFTRNNSGSGSYRAAL